MFRRRAFVRQSDQSDCGAAALATVARDRRKGRHLLASDFRSNGTFPNFTDTAPEIRGFSGRLCPEILRK